MTENNVPYNSNLYCEGEKVPFGYYEARWGSSDEECGILEEGPRYSGNYVEFTARGPKGCWTGNKVVITNGPAMFIRELPAREYCDSVGKITWESRIGRRGRCTYEIIEMVKYDQDNKTVVLVQLNPEDPIREITFFKTDIVYYPTS